MPTKKSPRKGSLQFWPRKRAKKFLPSVNWKAINNSEKNLLKGFICYKAGMKSVQVKDNTPNSMTLGKNITIPATIIECPNLKILSVRFYKNNNVKTEILLKDIQKELKSKIKIPKKQLKEIESLKKEDYDDIRILVYSIIKKTKIKKTPDITELGLTGTFDEKLNFVKEKINKELEIFDFFEKGQLVDFRGLTKGKGLQGPVKRFGITLKSHKSEKGVRKPGSIGPWHPARVTFRVPMAGQLGMFTRAIYNNKIIELGKFSEDQKFLKNIKNYGNIKTNYIIVTGSVQGPSKRQLLITSPLRETKKSKRKKYDLIEVK
jgi:large subunit ribosomal protein L3